ncbi:hypothetical protein Maes01_01875 [Microbulbifer aestuariivivens]|uniref:Outer membrane protein beta-barrel domain-containing protein n=1 Tax=Microbulbifer aestuariivivens TaxID=1908308 RepID=A0ABP9WQK9_9GAMM
MKKIVGAFALFFSLSAGAVEWNNPFERICLGEYQVVGTIGLGQGELQINDERDFYGYGSIGISPSLGLWQIELRYTNFDDGGVDIDQYGINFKVDFTLDCDVQCLYWMAGWNYSDLDVHEVIRGGEPVIVDKTGHDNYWNLGVGYRYRWTQKFDTSLEYMYNDVGRVDDYDLGSLRGLTINLAYRF